MGVHEVLFSVATVWPAASMLVGALVSPIRSLSVPRLWRALIGLCAGALLATCFTLWARAGASPLAGVLQTSTLTLVLAVLVQLLGLVITAFSARYLQGEAGQRRYIAALASVLASVHVLLLADHWLLLIAAWLLVGIALEQLLCFYPNRPFARLAAHKKQIADRAADALLVGAAVLAWGEVGSGSLSDLWAHVGREGLSTALQCSAVGVVLAVILRTALLPVHGWLIQVMEAPTPVSALLHAGVVNLGGFVLIRFAPLLEQAIWARTLLVVFGLGTAVLAGMVMLTRISIKVRLAWSTVAQMGFMLLECGLGLYTLAALHLIGHSLYKAHAFLSASTVVRQTRLQTMHVPVAPMALSLMLAPIAAIAAVLLIQGVAGQPAWPWWWSVVLGLAWAPMLWLPAEHHSRRALGWSVASGVLMVVGLTGAALVAHALPFGLHDAPDDALGLVALLGMVALYLCLVTLQRQPQTLRTWRRWSYAGFYVDEAYTRLALQLWPTRWTVAPFESAAQRPAAALAADAC